jgi:hypothetical protein
MEKSKDEIKNETWVEKINALVNKKEKTRKSSQDELNEKRSNH